jgi:hypothetical protein
MQKSQLEAVALVAAVIASALALMLPVQYVWVTSISGFVLLLVLFSYDGEGYRPVFQSLAFSGACGLGVMLVSDVYYRWLAGKGEVHMAGGQIETLWLPLSWLCSTLAILAIDRIRMMGRADAWTRHQGPVQRGFIPQYAEPEVPPATTSRQPTVVQSSAPEPRPAPQPPPEPSPVLVKPAVVAPPTPPPKEVDIYVTLVGEGLNLMRTVRAEHVGRDFYKIVEPMPEGETWEFTPGQVVRCKKRNLSSGKGLVAVEEAPRAS